jgi:predicted MFS family arabinose efflux permease
MFQLPLGILLDRYGPRRVQATLVAIGGIGALIFAMAESIAVLTLARAIIGLGFAGGLMSGFKAVVIWVPEARRALANAWVMSTGALGLLIATAPMEMAVQSVGWRWAFVGLALTTLAVAALIFFAVPERTVEPSMSSLRQESGEVGRIYRDRVFLAMAPLLALTAGSHVAIQTLWVGPWLRDVAGLDRDGTAYSLFIMAAAFFVGILFTGAVADWFVRRGVSLLHVMMGFIALFLTSQALLFLDIRALDLALWSLFCMTGQVAILAYPWLARYFGARLSGRSNTAMNLLMFLVAFAVQYAIGAIIDTYPAPAPGRYDPAAYRLAFGAVLAVQLAALLWYLANAQRLRKAEHMTAPPG